MCQYGIYGCVLSYSFWADLLQLLGQMLMKKELKKGRTGCKSDIIKHDFASNKSRYRLE